MDARSINYLKTSMVSDLSIPSNYPIYAMEFEVYKHVLNTEVVSDSGYVVKSKSNKETFQTKISDICNHETMYACMNN